MKNISEEEQAEVLKNEASIFENQVHFARQYLVRGGYLDSSRRGVWNLTEKGLTTTGISEKDALELFKEQHTLHSKSKKSADGSDITNQGEGNNREQIVSPGFDGHKDQLLQILRGLTPGGFERISQRLPLESGFERVTVTGGPGDQEIDGIGILQLNLFVSFKVPL